MLKYEYDGLLDAERRKAKSDLTDLRSSLEKAKREEIERMKEDLRAKHEQEMAKIKRHTPTVKSAEMYEKKKADLEKEIRMDVKQEARKEAEKDFESLKVFSKS